MSGAVVVNDLAILADRQAREIGAWEALGRAQQGRVSHSEYRGELTRLVTIETEAPDALAAELVAGGVPERAITVVPAAELAVAA